MPQGFIAQQGGGSGGLYSLLATWQQLGVFDLVLPFLLVFSLVFAVLQKAKILGEGKKNLNVIVSLIIAFFFLQNTYLLFVLQRFLPNVAITLVVFLMFLLLLGIFAGPHSKWSGSALSLAFIVSLIAIIIALSTDYFEPYGGGILSFYYNLGPFGQGMFWLIILIAVAIWFVSREEGGGHNKGENFLEKIVNGIGGR